MSLSRCKFGVCAAALVLVGLIVYAYSFFIPGPRSVIILSLAICLLSFLFAAFGFFVDKSKSLSISSLLISVTIYVFAYWLIPAGVL